MTCDMCGADDEQLEPVRRVYLVPERQVLDEVERWCVPCRTSYPHEEA